MPRGKTLWEMLVERVRGPVELTYHNPLRAKVGSAVSIDEPDWKDHNFFVREIREYDRTLGGRRFVFVDYVLLSRPLGGEEVWLRLRLVPLETPDSAAGLTHHALILQLYDEFAFDKEFRQVVGDTTGKFEVIEDDRVTEEYWRVHDVTEPYQAQVTLIRDTDGDGNATPGEVEQLRLEYWDYWREVHDVAGQPVRQYLIVEIDQGNGWTQIWRGQEADSQRVMVF